LDPISLILTAIAAGASAALQDAATGALKDAYSRLRSLLKRRLSGKTAALTAADEYVHEPEVWRAPLEHALAEIRAREDEELVRAAQAVMAQVDPSGTSAGKYTVMITGSKGFIVGDNARATMTFNERD
jgi:hypothetical protein